MRVLARAFFQTARHRLIYDHPRFLAAGYSAERLADRLDITNFGYMLDTIEREAKGEPYGNTGGIFYWLEHVWVSPQDQRDLKILTCKNREEWLEFAKNYHQSEAVQ